LALHLLKTSLPESLHVPRLNEVDLDMPVLLFSAAASILSSVIFGLAPALLSLKRNVREDLHESTRSVTSGHKARRLLVVAEIALALVLVSGAGLMVRSFLRLASVDVGFHAENVLTVRMLLLPVKKEAYHAESVREMLDRIRTLRRRFAYACVDWSERRPHIGGAVGAALLNVALKRKWVIQDIDSRALAITRVGRREIRTRFGLHD
jgi:hypothetical protein